MADLDRPHDAHLAGGPAGNGEIHHEESDVDIRAIFGFGAALLVVAAVVHLLIFVLFGFFNTREGLSGPTEYPLAVAKENRLPPEPRLQTNPREDLSELRAKEDQILGTYGWVDKNAGVVRIPIEVAMKLTLERGLPARQEQPR
jgi:hypothetical protein